jgi:hypothetical protein
MKITSSPHHFFTSSLLKFALPKHFLYIAQSRTLTKLSGKLIKTPNYLHEEKDHP